MNILLDTLFVGNQPIRIQHFLKVNFLSFFKNINHYLKIVYQNTFEINLSYFTKKIEKVQTDFLIDETFCWYKISDKEKVFLGKLIQAKNLLLMHILRTKALNLRLNIIWQRKKFCLFPKTWNWWKNRLTIYQRLFLYPTRYQKF